MSQTYKAEKRVSILLIDDSTTDLQLLLELMSVRNMRIHVAFNGKDGYRKTELLIPDLILLDVNMPVMDGIATCRMLKHNERCRHIPVIFLSANNEVEKRIEGLSVGAVDYIGKPFYEQEVIARIEIQLGIARQHKQITDDVFKESGFSPSARNNVLVRTATEYLREHLKQPPSPEALANIFGTNEKKLNEAFHAAFSLPVFSWLREEKLRQARELLATTEMPITDIGAYLGYSNPANFSTAFRERFGCSPRALRRELKNERLNTD